MVSNKSILEKDIVDNNNFPRENWARDKDILKAVLSHIPENTQLYKVVEAKIFELDPTEQFLIIALNSTEESFQISEELINSCNTLDNNLKEEIINYLYHTEPKPNLAQRSRQSFAQVGLTNQSLRYYTQINILNDIIKSYEEQNFVFINFPQWFNSKPHIIDQSLIPHTNPSEYIQKVNKAIPRLVEYHKKYNISNQIDFNELYLKKVFWDILGKRQKLGLSNNNINLTLIINDTYKIYLKEIANTKLNNKEKNNIMNYLCNGYFAVKFGIISVEQWHNFFQNFDIKTSKMMRFDTTPMYKEFTNIRSNLDCTLKRPDTLDKMRQPPKQTQDNILELFITKRNELLEYIQKHNITLNNTPAWLDDIQPIKTSPKSNNEYEQSTDLLIKLKIITPEEQTSLLVNIKQTLNTKLFDITTFRKKISKSINDKLREYIKIVNSYDQHIKSQVLANNAIIDLPDLSQSSKKRPTAFPEPTLVKKQKGQVLHYTR